MRRWDNRVSKSPLTKVLGEGDGRVLESGRTSARSALAEVGADPLLGLRLASRTGKHHAEDDGEAEAQRGSSGQHGAPAEQRLAGLDRGRSVRTDPPQGHEGRVVVRRSPCCERDVQLDVLGRIGRAREPDQQLAGERVRLGLEDRLQGRGVRRTDHGATASRGDPGQDRPISGALVESDHVDGGLVPLGRRDRLGERAVATRVCAVGEQQDRACAVVAGQVHGLDHGVVHVRSPGEADPVDRRGQRVPVGGGRDDVVDLVGEGQQPDADIGRRGVQEGLGSRLRLADTCAAHAVAGVERQHRGPDDLPGLDLGRRGVDGPAVDRHRDAAQVGGSPVGKLVDIEEERHRAVVRDLAVADVDPISCLRGRSEHGQGEQPRGSGDTKQGAHGHRSAPAGANSVGSTRTLWSARRSRKRGRRPVARRCP